jgi:hypothetical protein
MEKNQLSSSKKSKNDPYYKKVESLPKNPHLDMSDPNGIVGQNISPQSQFQNEIQTNLEALIQYKKTLNDCVQNRLYPDLNLEVISSATLTKGLLITLNPWGLCPTEQFQSLR